MVGTLRFHCEGLGSIPGRGTQILWATGCSQKEKKNQQTGPVCLVLSEQEEWSGRWKKIDRVGPCVLPIMLPLEISDTPFFRFLHLQVYLVLSYTPFKLAVTKRQRWGRILSFKPPCLHPHFSLCLEYLPPHPTSARLLGAFLNVILGSHVWCFSNRINQYLIYIP